MSTQSEVLDLVYRHRDNARLLRAQEARIARDGLGRNAQASEANAQDRQAALARIESTLYEAFGERRLAGLLRSEHELASRLAVARRAGQQRPELRDRLRDTRQQIDTLLTLFRAADLVET